MKRERSVQLWLVLGAIIALSANALAVFVSNRTFEAMGGISEFARAVRRHDQGVAIVYNLIAFPGTMAVIVAYVWPIVLHFRRRVPGAPSIVVQRRVVSTPLVVAALGLTPWVLGCFVFPALTISHFGRWSPELVSPQVLSPLVSGFLAATTTYLLLDWVFRAQLAPRMFPAGRLTEVPGVLALGVRARLLVFLVAVAFTPLFTMFGLVRAAVVRVEAGLPVAAVVHLLARASGITFVVYIGLGMLLTLLLARTLTRPLSEMAAALRRVQAGNLDTGVQVTASDEVGVLEDGVNAMVAALREKEHILRTFGRVVEPSVRDRLLSGELRLGGELRTASVLFCDLRGFTALAEHAAPGDVVTMLNEFFGAMTGPVRECDGFVDKFIGDALLVVFGLFDGSRDAAAGATAAVRCAQGMRVALRDLNAARTTAGRSSLAVAVSVHTGEVVAGRIGAEDRYEYTVIGDTVNVAARLQQHCKERGYSLLVSEATYELAAMSGMASGATTSDFVTLRGRNAPVRVFGVV